MNLKLLHLLFKNRHSIVPFQRCIWMNRLFRAETRESTLDKDNAPSGLRFDARVLENPQKAHRAVRQVVEFRENHMIL
jgi:hypothetical protein